MVHVSTIDSSSISHLWWDNAKYRRYMKSTNPNEIVHNTTSEMLTTRDYVHIGRLTLAMPYPQTRILNSYPLVRTEEKLRMWGHNNYACMTYVGNYILYICKSLDEPMKDGRW